LTARYISPSDNTTTIKVELSYNSTTYCGNGQIGLPDNSCSDYSVVSNEGSVSNNYSPGQTRFYAFAVPEFTNVNSMTATFTASMNSNNYLSKNAYVLGATSNMSYPFTIYVRRGAAPDLVNMLYDAMFTMDFNGTAQQISIPSPIFGDWFYQIVNTGVNTVDVTIEMSYQACPSGAGIAGPDCAVPYDLTNQDINNSTWVNGTGGFQYFMVTDANLVVGTGTETLASIAPPILASFLNWPSNDSFIVSSKGNTVNLITASVPMESLKDLKLTTSNVTWNIAVWSFAGQSYYIWANHACANNCTYKNVSEGTCNDNTGYCTCDSGYSGLWCEKSGLKLIWIILIVIAVAIVLAIATGVPIACYLKSKKRKQYERV